ncbi:MAG: hypothetical protein H6828_03975 [Planctomycetes bacterium]|nr:hypothetical protein [Planctomycetota bacterium]
MNEPPTARVVRFLATRPWARALAQAGAALYLPVALVYLVGPVGDCAHCARLYLLLSPALPGFIAGMALPRAVQQGPRIALAAATSALLCALVAWAFHALGPRGRTALACAVGALSLWNAWALSALMRAL